MKDLTIPVLAELLRRAHIAARLPLPVRTEDLRDLAASLLPLMTAADVVEPVVSDVTLAAPTAVGDGLEAWDGGPPNFVAGQCYQDPMAVPLPAAGAEEEPHTAV